MKIWIFVIKFFFISALLIVSNENLALKYPEAREKFYDMYSIWIKETFTEAKQITGYVTNSRWLPETEELAKKQLSPENT